MGRREKEGEEGVHEVGEGRRVSGEKLAEAGILGGALVFWS